MTFENFGFDSSICVKTGIRLPVARNPGHGTSICCPEVTSEGGVQMSDHRNTRLWDKFLQMMFSNGDQEKYIQYRVASKWLCGLWAGACV